MSFRLWYFYKSALRLRQANSDLSRCDKVSILAAASINRRRSRTLDNTLVLRQVQHFLLLCWQQVHRGWSRAALLCKIYSLIQLQLSLFSCDLHWVFLHYLSFLFQFCRFNYISFVSFGIQNRSVKVVQHPLCVACCRWRTLACNLSCFLVCNFYFLQRRLACFLSDYLSFRFYFGSLLA